MKDRIANYYKIYSGLIRTRYCRSSESSDVKDFFNVNIRCAEEIFNKYLKISEISIEGHHDFINRGQLIKYKLFKIVSFSYRRLLIAGDDLLVRLLSEIEKQIDHGELEKMKYLSDAIHNLPKAILLNQLKYPPYHGGVNLNNYFKDNPNEDLEFYWEKIKVKARSAISLT